MQTRTGKAPKGVIVTFSPRKTSATRGSNAASSLAPSRAGPQCGCRTRLALAAATRIVAGSSASSMPCGWMAPERWIGSRSQAVSAPMSASPSADNSAWRGSDWDPWVAFSFDLTDLFGFPGEAHATDCENLFISESLTQ